mgnify:FL=1|jgi:hypothetical protein|tara:strand:- start:68 stop:682 length:615 start_codon:yes stop_codon:yes gene_type:complete
MANTTFNGPVRSENGFEDISIAAVTGVETTNSTYGTNATIGGSISNPTGMIAATVSKTQMANGFAAAMVKNTHYLSPANGAAITATLPAQASSTSGDVIIVEYQVIVANGATHKFGTAGEFFLAKSAVYKMTGATGSAVGLINTVDVADGTADDFLNLVGLTNSGPGIGSYVVFTFNGTVWRAEARCTSSGTGAAANLSVFATS